MDVMVEKHDDGRVKYVIAASGYWWWHEGESVVLRRPDGSMVQTFDGFDTPLAKLTEAIKSDRA